MKIQSLFDLITDARDVTDFFAKVESPEQMVSRLERIKRGEAEDFLATVEALQISLAGMLEDTLEMSSSGLDNVDSDSDFDGLGLEEDEDKTQAEPEPTGIAKEKS
jgi:hypothetical protein